MCSVTPLTPERMIFVCERESLFLVPLYILHSHISNSSSRQNVSLLLIQSAQAATVRVRRGYLFVTSDQVNIETDPLSTQMT